MGIVAASQTTCWTPLPTGSGHQVLIRAEEIPDAICGVLVLQHRIITHDPPLRLALSRGTELGQELGSWLKRRPPSVRIRVASAQQQRAASIVERIARGRLAVHPLRVTAGMVSVLP